MVFETPPFARREGWAIPRKPFQNTGLKLPHVLANHGTQGCLISGHRIVSGNRSEIGYVDAIRGGVHDEGVTTEMGWSVFEDSILIGGILLNDGHRAHTIGRVNAVQDGIVTRAIDSCPDG